MTSGRKKRSSSKSKASGVSADRKERSTFIALDPNRLSVDQMWDAMKTVEAEAERQHRAKKG